MHSVILEKNRLGEALAALQSAMDVLVPGRDAAGRTVFLPPDSEAFAAKGLTDSGNTSLSPKGLIFPQTEEMLRFAAAPGGDMEVSERLPEPGATLVLGARPCDAKALTILDKVFCPGKQGDPYYRIRRDNTVLFGLACNHPCPTCFCTRAGSGPHDGQGLDALWVDLGEKYLIEPLSDKGRAAVDALAGLTPAAPADLDEARALADEAASRLSAGTGPGDLLDIPALCELPLWEELAATCLNCGACTYVCPTCHCFDIQDETTRGAGRRVRLWDSCMFPLFTLHASGHNPRGEKAARVRQRFLHKLRYMPEKLGELGCVGCGRCIGACPVNIDIREVMRVLEDMAMEAAG